MSMVPFSFSITIYGTAPRYGETTWSGSYDLVGNLTETNHQTCSVNHTGNITATQILPLNSTYNGSINNLGGFGSNTHVSQHIIQKTTAVNNRYPMSGAIIVEGSPCFTSGAAGSKSPNSIAGDQTSIGFIMNDGSELYFFGTILDPMASTIDAAFLVRGGKCSGLVGSSTLVLQNTP